MKRLDTSIAATLPEYRNGGYSWPKAQSNEKGRRNMKSISEL